MNLKEASILLNKHPNFFSIMKCKSPLKYKYITSLEAKNIYEQYLAYQEEQKTVLDALAEQYYWLEENRLLFEFSKILHQTKILKHKNSFSTGGKSIIFSCTEGFYSHQVYIKYLRILRISIVYKRKKEREKIQIRNKIKTKI